MSQWGRVVGGETCGVVAARLQEVERRWWSHCVGGGGARALGLSTLGWRGHCLGERQDSPPVASGHHLGTLC